MPETQIETRKRGRPGKGARRQIVARVPEADAALIKRAAQARGTTLNDYVGEVVMRDATANVGSQK